MIVPWQQVGVDALIAPKAFKAREKDVETMLIYFDLYMKTINNLFIATGRTLPMTGRRLPCCRR